jgi:hypothetical protein
MMVDALTARVPAVIVAHSRPVAQGRAPPPIVLHHRPGESSCTNVCLGLFLYRDVGLQFAC